MPLFSLGDIGYDVLKFPIMFGITYSLQQIFTNPASYLSATNITYPTNLNWSLPRHFTPSSTEPLALSDILDVITVLSLFLVLLILGSSYLLSMRVLKTSTSTGLRVLFIWHLFDFLIHTIFEGSFLYNCFFTSQAFDAERHHPGLITNFQQRPDLLYGAAYGDNWATKLWMVYAQADARWAGADLTVVSLELLTVLVAGPLALWICYGIQKEDWRIYYWMIVLATGEIYGGFMTFVPEWLTGSLNLDTSNFMYTWVYLAFFNLLWIVFPLYAMWFSYMKIRDPLGTFERAEKALSACDEARQQARQLVAQVTIMLERNKSESERLDIDRTQIKADRTENNKLREQYKTLIDQLSGTVIRD